MAIRILLKLNTRIYSDTAKKNALFAPDDALSEEVIDSFDQHSSSDFVIAATASEDLPLGDMDTIKGMYLAVDADCVVKLNGGTEQIQMRKPSTSSLAKLCIEADITQVNITAGAATLNGTICVWGTTTGI